MLFITLVALYFALCGDSRAIRGAGAVLAVSRPLPSFSAIRSAGAMHVNVLPASTNRVIISGYENLVPLVQAVVNEDTLHLSLCDANASITNNNLRVTVYAEMFSEPSLEERMRVNAMGALTLGGPEAWNDPERADEW